MALQSDVAIDGDAPGRGRLGARAGRRHAGRQRGPAAVQVVSVRHEEPVHEGQPILVGGHRLVDWPEIEVAFTPRLGGPCGAIPRR